MNESFIEEQHQILAWEPKVSLNKALFLGGGGLGGTLGSHDFRVK